MTVSSSPSDSIRAAQAVLFDLDGVITDTASLHRVAWAQLFTHLFDELNDEGVEVRPYTEQDYYDTVDGKPRFDGIRALLAERGIEIPTGTPDDGPEMRTVHGLGSRKNAVFLGEVAAGNVRSYAGSVRLLDWLREHAVPCAVVSSSRNAVQVLTAAGLADRFVLILDGGRAEDLGLAGKPAPDTFAWAAQQLGAAPAATVVIEDAVSGIAAAAAAGLHAVAVDRGAGAAALAEAGAELVVTDLAQLIPVSDPVDQEPARSGT